MYVYLEECFMQQFVPNTCRIFDYLPLFISCAPGDDRSSNWKYIRLKSICQVNVSFCSLHSPKKECKYSFFFLAKRCRNKTYMSNVKIRRIP